MREEIFGPVVAIIPFDDEADAIRLANDTPYGLSGSIWSRDIGKALRVAKAVQAGVLSINCNSSVHTEAPFGGYKMSGVGRELGMHAWSSTPRSRTSSSTSHDGAPAPGPQPITNQWTVVDGESRGAAKCTVNVSALVSFVM